MVYTGNYISSGDAYNASSQGIVGLFGRKIVKWQGVAILTDTLQTSLPVYVYPPRNKELAAPVYGEAFPTERISLPVGAQILSTSFRLPENKLTGYQYEWGKQLPTGCTIIGTSTDVLKVSFDGVDNIALAGTASVASASNSYTPGTAVRAARGWTTADSAGAVLDTIASTAKLVRLAVDNAANTGAGTGIRLSLAGATAAVAVDVIGLVAEDAIRFEEIPNLYKEFMIRS